MNERPGTTAAAFFHSAAECLPSPVTLDYLLVDEESDQAPRVAVQYSTTGGGSWSPATNAGGGSGVTDLAADPAGVPHQYAWDAALDGVNGDHDLRLRVEALHQSSTNLPFPIQRTGMSADSPPFRVCTDPGRPLPLEENAAWVSDESDYTQRIAWGDWDGDGDLDLAVGNHSDTDPNRIYVNNGGLLETSASWSSTEGDNTISVAWGDWDGDGDLDLAVGNDGQPNRVYVNTGSGLSTAATWSSTELQSTISVAWGDWDGDGDLDLAVGNIGAIASTSTLGTL